jgi:homoserine O-acetyltransferase
LQELWYQAASVLRAALINASERDGLGARNARAMHYATLGSPHRAANGDINNAVMVLHWTGSSGASLLTEEYIASLFAMARPWTPVATI